MLRSPSRGRWIQLAVGVALSVGLIWYAFRATPFRDVWSRMATMHRWPMFMAVILATLPFVLRVPRWSLLLRHEDGRPIRRRHLWQAIAMGFAGNNTLPFRLGEVLRMGAISRLAPVPFPSALGSVAVERVLDALTAIALLSGALIVADLPAGDLSQRAHLTGILGLALLVGAVAVARWPRLALGPLEALLPTGRVREALIGIVSRVIAGLAALGDPRRALPVVGWSLVIWCVNASAFWVAFRAFDIDIGFAGALILQGALLIGIALPSTPGYAGVFEAAIWGTLLTLFGVPMEIGLAYAIAYHVLTFVPITVLGVHALFTSGLSLRTMREAAE